MMESRRSVLVAIFFTTLVLCSLVPTVAGATMEVTPISTAQTASIASDGKVILLHFRADDLAVLNFTFNVTEGGPVDALFLDETGYEEYRLGFNASFYLDGSVLNASQGLGTIDGLSSGQEYYLVIDNSASPLGGADPVGNVVVEYGFSGQNITEISDQSDLVLVALILVVLVFIAVVIVLARSHKAEKEPGSKVMGLERKYCPKCGEIVETYVHKCPKCGHEW
jgi:hypothetical protein